MSTFPMMMMMMNKEHAKPSLLCVLLQPMTTYITKTLQMYESALLDWDHRAHTGPASYDPRGVPRAHDTHFQRTGHCILVLVRIPSALAREVAPLLIHDHTEFDRKEFELN